MVTLAGGGFPLGRGQLEPIGSSDPDRAESDARSDKSDRELRAYDNDRVYQSAGDQYIFHGEPVRRSPVTRRNTLPRDTATFTGRTEELTKLTDAVDRWEKSGEPLPIFAIDGMPGVGKTTLAIHAAHLIQDHFQDGAFYVEMHTHTATDRPVEPASALFDLLAADGVPPEKIAAGRDGRAAQWRARMAGRRALLIVDDAAGHRQVETLLPGAPGCLVLVTSRRRLAGLGSRYAVETLTLDTLPPDHARTLFVSLVNRHLGDGESRAVGALIRLCGHLPLAITILAAKLRFEPQWRVTDLVDDLSATRDRLAHMRAEDLAVVSAIDLSYRNLSHSRRRFFRRLGLTPGVDIDPYAAAALDGSTLEDAQRHLDELYAEHLIDQPTHRRYRMHDLIRDYARGRARKDPDADRLQSVTRLLDYYLHTAAQANRLIDPHAAAVVLGPLRPDVPVPGLSSPVEALAWLRRERGNLFACVAYAQYTDGRRVIAMSDVLAAFLRRTGPWPQAITLHETAAEAARRLGDRAADVDATLNIAILLRLTGDYPAALSALDETLTAYRCLRNRRREADGLNELSITLRLSGNVPDATATLEQAFAIYGELGDELGQANALNNLGALRRITDDHSGARDALERALALYRTHNDQYGRAEALLRLGMVHRTVHDYAAATHALRAALTIYQELDYRLGQANAWGNLGVVLRLKGDHAGAIEALLEALAIHNDLGNQLGQAVTYNNLSIAQRLCGDLAGAAISLNLALTAYRDIRDPYGQAAALHNLGVIRCHEGDLPAARDAFDKALGIFRDLDERLGQAEVRNDTGALALQCGDTGTAATDFAAALRLAREVSSPVEAARALEGLATCALHEGRSDRAIDHLVEALRIYRRLGTPDEARVAHRLARLAQWQGI